MSLALQLCCCSMEDPRATSHGSVIGASHAGKGSKPTARMQGTAQLTWVVAGFQLPQVFLEMYENHSENVKFDGLHPENPSNWLTPSINKNERNWHEVISQALTCWRSRWFSSSNLSLDLLTCMPKGVRVPVWFGDMCCTCCTDRKGVPADTMLSRRLSYRSRNSASSLGPWEQRAAASSKSLTSWDRIWRHGLLSSPGLLMYSCVFGWLVLSL